MEKKVYFNEYGLSKATLMWLVSIQALTHDQARLIDALNRVGFNIDSDVESLYYGEEAE